MWDSLRKILLGCGELWEPPQGLPRISGLELSKRFASPGNFTPLMFYFWGGLLFKRIHKFQNIQSNSGSKFTFLLGAMPTFRDLFFGFRDGRGPPPMTHQAERLLRNHVPHRDRSDGAVRSQLLPMSRLTRSLGSLKHGEVHGRSVYFRVNMEDGFLRFFLGGKKNKGWNLQP